jgi:plasmid stability protein
MTHLLVKNIDDDVMSKLECRARRNGHSTEEEAREILQDAFRDERGTGETLDATVIHSLDGRGDRLKSLPSAPDLAETLMEISLRCSSLPDLHTQEADEILGLRREGLIPRPVGLARTPRRYTLKLQEVQHGDPINERATASP